MTKVIKGKIFKDGSLNDKVICNKHFYDSFIPSVVRDCTLDYVVFNNMPLHTEFRNCVLNIKLIECDHRLIFKDCTYRIKILNRETGSYDIITSED